MSTPTYQVERRRLADRLRNLRREAGLSGARLARQLGWGQPKVSKIETARQLPSDDDIRAWAAAVDAEPDITQELLDRLVRARADYAAWRDAYRSTGAPGVQEDILTLEAGSTRIVEFQPSMIPGLLQTAEYARELLQLPSGPAALGATPEDINRMVAVRLQRQQVLYDPSKRVTVILLEAALRTRVCEVPTLIGQLDRLTAMAGLPSLDLAIIPTESPVPIFPLSGFRLYDDLVTLETITGEEQLTSADDIALYEGFLDALRANAKHATEATTVVRRVLANLQHD